MTTMLGDPTAFLIGMAVVVVLWAVFCSGSWR